MTCRDMDDVISSRPGESVRGLHSAEHLVHCERCRCLARALDVSREELRLSERQLLRIQTDIVASLTPVRPLPPYWILLFACVIVCLCLVAVGALLRGMNGWIALSMVQRIAMFATLGAGAVLLASSIVRQMVPGSKHAIAPAALAIAILAALMLMIAATFRSQPESAFIAGGLMCMKNGLTYSIPAAFLLWLILRRGAILYPKLIGAAAGGLAGLIGLSVLEVNCPNLNAFHILVWHGGVVLISAVAGVLFGTAVEYIERWRDQKASESLRQRKLFYRIR